MMYRTNRRNGDYLGGPQQWPGLSWQVELSLNSRMSIVSALVIAQRKIAADDVLEGSVFSLVAPFDDLGRLLRRLCEEAALETDRQTGMAIAEWVDTPLPGM
jgi:hypothetical protein